MSHAASPPVEFDENAPASRRHLAGFGFYVYLLSDCVLFATFFAAFAVLRGTSGGDPADKGLFDLGNTFIETACLLTSSLTCGLAMIASDRRDVRTTLIALAFTFALGFAFLFLEIHEFSALLAKGATPSRSAFLSAFFTLVSTHGLHVTAGLVWLVVIFAQTIERGLSPGVIRRLVCFSLFWHVIDVVWIGVFSFVYLMGTGS